jgi:hypothetical protein
MWWKGCFPASLNMHFPSPFLLPPEHTLGWIVTLPHTNRMWYYGNERSRLRNVVSGFGLCSSQLLGSKNQHPLSILKMGNCFFSLLKPSSTSSQLNLQQKLHPTRRARIPTPPIRADICRSSYIREERERSTTPRPADFIAYEPLLHFDVPTDTPSEIGLRTSLDVLWHLVRLRSTRFKLCRAGSSWFSGSLRQAKKGGNLISSP